MSRFNPPTTDGDLVTALKNFSAAMETYAATLGFDAAEEALVIEAYETFDSANTAASIARQAAQAATATKNITRETSLDIMRAFAQRIKNNPNATPEIQGAFGLNLEPQISGPVQTPNALIASAQIDGSCRLKWRHNGNAPATTYQIETSPNGTDWSFLATTTAAKFKDIDAPVGVVRWYRVRAARAGQISSWSNFAVIYGGISSLSIRAAA